MAATIELPSLIDVDVTEGRSFLDIDHHNGGRSGPVVIERQPLSDEVNPPSSPTARKLREEQQARKPDDSLAALQGPTKILRPVSQGDSVPQQNWTRPPKPANPPFNFRPPGIEKALQSKQRHALDFLMAWLRTIPGQQAAASVPLPNNARERLRAVTDIFKSATRMNAGSADAHVALGVLLNLARDYDGSVGAFRTALQTRTTDYSLWNKLGATLANSARSGEAIDAYQKALDLKPNYMRAWVNMGIAQANLAEYDAAARFYTRALLMNPQASGVWGYLRNVVLCSGRTELLQAVEDEDLTTLNQALPLE